MAFGGGTCAIAGVQQDGCRFSRVATRVSRRFLISFEALVLRWQAMPACALHQHKIKNVTRFGSLVPIVCMQSGVAVSLGQGLVKARSNRNRHVTATSGFTNAIRGCMGRDTGLDDRMVMGSEGWDGSRRVVLTRKLTWCAMPSEELGHWVYPWSTLGPDRNNV